VAYYNGIDCSNPVAVAKYPSQLSSGLSDVVLRIRPDRKPEKPSDVSGEAQLLVKPSLVSSDGTVSALDLLDIMLDSRQQTEQCYELSYDEMGISMAHWLNWFAVGASTHFVTSLATAWSLPILRMSTTLLPWEMTALLTKPCWMSLLLLKCITTASIFLMKERANKLMMMMLISPSTSIPRTMIQSGVMISNPLLGLRNRLWTINDQHLIQEDVEEGWQTWWETTNNYHFDQR
jgi:hypothetical protein